jgi:hypothetical protein
LLGVNDGKEPCHKWWNAFKKDNSSWVDKLVKKQPLGKNACQVDALEFKNVLTIFANFNNDVGKRLKELVLARIKKVDAAPPGEEDKEAPPQPKVVPPAKKPPPPPSPLRAFFLQAADDMERAANMVINGIRSKSAVMTQQQRISFALSTIKDSEDKAFIQQKTPLAALMHREIVKAVVESLAGAGAAASP